jgi:hypothetical protein
MVYLTVSLLRGAVRVEFVPTFSFMPLNELLTPLFPWLFRGFHSLVTIASQEFVLVDDGKAQKRHTGSLQAIFNELESKGFSFVSATGGDADSEEFVFTVRAE